jgi:hypothetical protein
MQRSQDAAPDTPKQGTQKTPNKSIFDETLKTEGLGNEALHIAC